MNDKGLQYESKVEDGEMIITLAANSSMTKKIKPKIKELIENLGDSSSEEEKSTCHTFVQYDFEDAKNKLKQEKEAAESEFKELEKLEFFEYWEEDKSTSRTQTEYIQVASGSEEWKMVDQKLNQKLCVMRPSIDSTETCNEPDCKTRKFMITKLERIQNYAFLERYSLKLKAIKDKYAKLPHIKIDSLTKTMFHGTNDVDPKFILGTEEGLDKRYTSANLFGIGVYFAICSDYCYPGFIHKLVKNGDSKIVGP